MKVRKRILLLATLLMLVSVGGIVNLMWQMPHIEQLHDLKSIVQVLILLGLFGTGLVFSILELVRQEIRSPIFHLTAQVARLKERKINGHRLELTGSRDVDLLTRTLNELLDDFEIGDNLSRIFAEASPDMIFLLDEDGSVLFGNTNAARQWNFQADEMIGKRQEELFPPDIAKRHKQVIKKIFETGQPFSTDVQEMIGERHRWIDARIIPVLDKNNYVTAVLGIFRDITERKRAEEALRDSEAQLRDITFSMADWEWEVDEKGVYTHSSSKGLELLGDVIGKTPFDFMPPDEAKRVAAIFSEIAQNKVPIKDLENWVIQKNGERICLLTNGVPILDKAGNLKGYRGANKDITERKRAEETLNKNIQLLRDTGEMAKVGGWELDPSTKEVLWTEEVYRIHGVEPGYKPKLEEALNFYAPESRSALEAALKKAAETGEPFDLESLFIPSGGKNKIWVRSMGSAVYDSGGTIVKLVGTFQNIDRYKRTEEALRESEQRYREVFDGTPDGIIVHDANGIILDANDVTARNLETTRAALIGRRLAEFVTSANAAAIGAHAASVLSGKAQVFETTYISASGKPTPAEVHEHRIQWKDGQAVLSSARDITARKRAEEEKHLMEERSRKVVEDIFRFIPEGILVFSRKMELLRQNQAFRELVSGYARRLGFTEDELENLIIDKVKAGLRDNNIKEIRIARKHETGKQT